LGTRQKPMVTPEFNFNSLIVFVERLASLREYATQKKFFEKFIEDHYNASATIWLTSPHKSFPSNTQNYSFPFDPDINPDLDTKSTDWVYSWKIENNFWLALPFSYRGNAFGKLFLSRNYPFTEQDITTLKHIIVLAGLAFFTSLQAQLHQWHQKQLNLVRSVAMKISQITDLNALTSELSRLIQATFNYYYVAIFLIREQDTRLYFKASAGPDESQRPEFEDKNHPGFALGEHMIGYVAQTGTEIVANDVDEEPRYHSVDSLAETKSEIVIPLKVETRIFGVLDIQANYKNAFDNDDLLVLRALADNIAIAIEGAHLYQTAQTKAVQLSIVSDVSRAITHILDINELLQQTVMLIHDRFHIPYVHLYTIDHVQQQISFKAGSGSRTKLYEEAEVSFNIKSDKGIIPWVVQNGCTKRVSDVKQEPLFLKAPISSDIKGSEMVIPLSFAGEILGVLDLQSDEINAFSDEDQHLMETLGDNLAIAIRNAWLYRSEIWRRHVAESLKDVAGLLSENIDLNAMLTTILEKLYSTLPCDVAGIWLFNNDSYTMDESDDQRLYLAAYKSSPQYPDNALAGLFTFPDSRVKAVLSQKEPKIRQKNEPIGPIAAQFNFPQNHSSISTPLIAGQEVIGMLTMVHHTPNRYGVEAQRITAAFASYAAIAIQNNRLFLKTQEQAWISTVLLQVANAIQSLTDLNELTATIVRITPLVVGIKGCAIILRSAESNIFQLSAMYGITESSEEYRFEQPIIFHSSPALERLLTEQAPIFINDPQKDLNIPDNFSDQFNQHNLILLPLIARNEVLGTFLLANEIDPRKKEQTSGFLTEEHQKIVQGIVQQTAIAIENIQLIEARQEEAYISAVLLQTAQAIVASADLQDTLDSMVNIMPILVGIESSLIYLWAQNQGVFYVAHAATPSTVETKALLGQTFEPGEFPLLDAIFQNNRPNVHPLIETSLSPEDWDLALPDEDQIDPSPILQTHYPLLMGFPLSVKEEVFGILIAKDDNFATNRERRFELLWGIAQQASLAIQNDRLNQEMLDRQRIEREFQLAREIQQTFLPSQIPDLPGWEIDVRWETARQVGGDFYDYFLLPDGRLAFVIADVSDKGLAASLYMAVTRTLLRAAALESDSPSKTLELVNEFLLENSQNGLFVTTFYGILNLQDGNLSYTNAGHNRPVLIRHQQNDTTLLNKGGIALGALPKINLPLYETLLNQGDCLLLYTDGVTEAFNLHDQMYGDARFLKVINGLIGSSAHQVLEAIEADLAEFRGGAPLSDDTTLLAIRRL